MKPRLSTRLFASYAVVVVVGAAVAYLTVRLLAPRLFDEQMHGRGIGAGRGAGMGAGQSTRDAFRSSLNTALLVAVCASAAAAGLIALWVGRRIARPITAIRSATGRLAGGDYAARVPGSPVPELAELAEDVNSLAVELAGTEARRVRLLGDVAHEMRTPLTVLDGYVEGLVDGVFTPDQDTLAPLSQELHRLHRLAEDLASLSRAEENRIELHIEANDLAALARDTAQRLSAQFVDAGIHLDVDAKVAVPVRCDAQRIEQALTNLLGNALAATPAGGTVTIRVRCDPTAASAIVSDTGVGLNSDELEHVFERFYRAHTPHSPQRTRSAGTGIGLTIARSIARAHHGELTATSNGYGTGAQFTLTIPVAP